MTVFAGRLIYQSSKL